MTKQPHYKPQIAQSAPNNLRPTISELEKKKSFKLGFVSGLLIGLLILLLVLVFWAMPTVDSCLAATQQMASIR